MPYDSRRRVIVVEGATYSGKSTLFREMKREFPGSTVIEFHDYYHNQLLRPGSDGEGLSIEQVNSGDIPADVQERVKKYNIERIDRAVRQMEMEGLESFLFERLHGTDYVYRNLLFMEDDFSVYMPAEQRLNSEDAALVVITVEDDVMGERMRTTSKPERLGKSDFPVPYHILDFDTLRRKRDLYNHFYDVSAIDRKLLVVSTNQTDNSEVIKKVREMW